MKKETKIGWCILAGLTAVSVLFKLTMFPAMPWLWVFAPLWLPWAAAIATAVLVIIWAATMGAWKALREIVANGKL